MTLRKIAQVGHPILRENARHLTKEELASSEVQSLIDDLIETMRDAQGAGLAAIQIYEPVSICTIEVGDNPRYPYKPKVPLTVLVNPVLEELGNERFENFEGCLSVPNLRGVVSRAMRIRVRAWDRHGNDIDEEVLGITAGTYQHEVDHLLGKLFLDSVVDSKTLCTWSVFQRFHEADFAARVRAIVKRVGS
ncbi:MAG: peptide deformylase [Myxococcales bacterium]|nr:peptide deformylase [Myxococcales bacterium]